jgi:hypothetical protein
LAFVVQALVQHAQGVLGLSSQGRSSCRLNSGAIKQTSLTKSVDVSLDIEGVAEL